MFDKKSAEIGITINICWFRYWAAYMLSNGPHVLGNGPHVLGDGPHVLGNGPHVLGNGLHIC